jgi:hypothetical protein
MKTQSPDTSLEVEQVQFDLLRLAGTEGRMSRMRALTAFGISLSRQAIAEAHPEWSERAVLLYWAKINYGEEFTSRVRHHMETAGQ